MRGCLFDDSQPPERRLRGLFGLLGLFGLFGLFGLRGQFDKSA